MGLLSVPNTSMPSIESSPTMHVQAIQYVQEHPDEVCPAGWQPGEKTMKPDPVGSKEYFAAL